MPEMEIIMVATTGLSMCFVGYKWHQTSCSPIENLMSHYSVESRTVEIALAFAHKIESNPKLVNGVAESVLRVVTNNTDMPPLYDHGIAFDNAKDQVKSQLLQAFATN